MILDDLARADAGTDDGTAWSAADRADATAFSLAYAATLYSEDEELV